MSHPTTSALQARIETLEKENERLKRDRSFLMGIFNARAYYAAGLEVAGRDMRRLQFRLATVGDAFDEYDELAEAEDRFDKLLAALKNETPNVNSAEEVKADVSMPSTDASGPVDETEERNHSADAGKVDRE